MFLDRFIQTLNALCTFNEKDFPQIEPNFMVELIKKFYSIKDKQSVAQDLEGFSAKGLKTEAKILETNLIQGVEIERGRNLPKEILNTNFKYEKNGLIIYTPQSNYFNAKLKVLATQIILRVYVEITCPHAITLTKDDQTEV